MYSMRAIARSAPRTLNRLSSAALRQSVARPASLTRAAAWAPLRSTQFASPFSTTQLRAKPASEVDQELSAKLESELQYENELKESEPEPASIKDFLENSPFELIDTPGKEDVILKRKFGNETITVSFSISDLANYEPDMFNEDDALAEDYEGDASPQQRGAAEEGLEEDADADAAPPCRLNVVVEKEGAKGVLNIEAVAQDGQIVVENFSYYEDAALAHSTDAEATHKAQDAYPGPPFGTLDEDLQVLMERYLEERGVTEAFAIFVPDYMDLKEQREYQRWLKNVKAFVDV